MAAARNKIGTELAESPNATCESARLWRMAAREAAWEAAWEAEFSSLTFANLDMALGAPLPDSAVPFGDEELSNDANLYKDDFDSSEQSEEKEPTMHGFEMARFIFKESHTD